jgi:hypothetical protein
MSQAGRRTLLLDIRALPTSSTLGLSGGCLVATLAKSMTVALTAVAWVSAAVASDAVLRGFGYEVLGRETVGRANH